MKLKLHLILALFIGVSCNSQENEISLEEAKNQLQESIASMKEAIEFSNTPPKYNPSTTLSEGIVLKEYTKQDSTVARSKIVTYLDSIILTEKIEYPGNYIEIDYDRYDFKKLLGPTDAGFYGNSQEPIFVLNKITYKDESFQTVNDTIDYGVSSFEKGIMLDKSKPIEKFDITAFYNYPEVKKISLRKNILTEQLPEGPLTLKLLEDNVAYFVVPAAIITKIIDVIGYESEGNRIEKLAVSSEKALTEEDLNYFKKSIPLYESALRSIADNDFKNVGELKNYLVEKLPKQPDTNADVFIITYRFKDDIAAVDLFLQKNESAFTKHNIVVKNDNYEKTRFDFFAATDTITQKMGFVGLDGIWKEEPIFNGLRYENEFYYSALLEGEDVYIRLDEKNDAFEIVDYRVIDTEIYFKNLVIINRDWKLGVINAENNSIVIPTKYRAIDQEYGLFLVTTQNHNEGVFNKEGKVILSDTYYSISILEDKIQAHTKVEDGDDIYEEFDFTGKKIGNY